MPKAKQRRPSTRVTKAKVDPRVWTEAQRLAKGKDKWIEIVSPTEVIVRQK